jgi:Fic family protein
MIYETPKLGADDLDVVRLIHEQREQLRYTVAQKPNRWTGSLRRSTFARALQGSNSIEGINATLSEAAQIIDDEKPETVEAETYRALSGYRDALTYILQTHDDPYFELNAQVIKSLHFMMLRYDLTKMPGQWRPGTVFVVREPSGDIVYEGPDAALVPGLIDELVAAINSDAAVDPIVRGAMAHLNLTMIHPFKDGNGRMARALQTMVIARGGVLSPVFSSIEEWLGRNTDAYYRILEETGQGAWRPERSALPWVQFCLRAHYQQAATLIKRTRQLERAANEIGKLLEQMKVAERVAERVAMALLDAAFGFKVTSARYQTENEVTAEMAGRDLRQMSEAGLLEPVGHKRGRHYIAGAPLREVFARTRDDTRAGDPYDVLAQRRAADQLRLPGVR